MNEPTPRRSLVPGPGTNQGGLAAQAIAAREQQAIPRLQEPVRSAPAIMPLQSVGNLAKAIANVMANVGTIEKSGYNAFHRYKYAKIEDILAALTPLMGQNGIAIFQNEIEIKTVENRIAITYEFTVAHTSNETMQGLRQTGMCMARNSKGDYDDKAINKCHTQARKYFLLSLFQVPSGDFEDADEGPAQPDTNQRQEKAPVPGPKDAAPERSARDQAMQQAEKASARAAEDGIPHKIVLGQGAGADQWANAFIRAIGKSMSQDEIKRWDAANDHALQSMSQHYPEVYAAIEAAVERRISDLGAPKQDGGTKPGLGNGSGMPNPGMDAQEAMNWVAGQLQQLKSWEGAKAFWNQYVMPRENEFDQLDWEMLMAEWRRTELRLAPPDEPTPDA